MRRKTSPVRLVFVVVTVMALGAACTTGSPPTPTEAPAGVAAVKATPIPAATAAAPVEPSPTNTVAPSATPTLAPSSTATTTPTFTPTAKPVVVLYQDDFSDPDSGWEHYREADGILDYEDGGYRMLIQNPSNLFWVQQGSDWQDVSVEVDATKVGGPDANRFGLMCRLSNTTYEYYGFLISSDGSYGIGRIVRGQVELIGSDAWQHSEAIEQGQATNRIRVTSVGNTLTLYVNGQQLLQVQDDTLASGDIGLVAGTVGEPGTDILFNNFSVTEP